MQDSKQILVSSEGGVFDRRGGTGTSRRYGKEGAQYACQSEEKTKKEDQLFVGEEQSHLHGLRKVVP